MSHRLVRKNGNFLQTCNLNIVVIFRIALKFNIKIVVNIKLQI